MNTATTNQDPGSVLQATLARVLRGKSDAELEAFAGGKAEAKLLRTLASGPKVFILASFTDSAREQGEGYFDERDRLTRRVSEILRSSPDDVVFILD